MMSLSFRSRALCLVTLVVPVLMVLCLFAVEAQAGNSSEERAVLETVQRFFDAMTNRDAEAALEVMIPEGRFFSLREENGETAVAHLHQSGVRAGSGDPGAGSPRAFLGARGSAPGGIATVWTPYDFFLDGEFHHCGIDAFDLLNDGTGWKITGGVYTVETSGCPESPLGPPATDIE